MSSSARQTERLTLADREASRSFLRCDLLESISLRQQRLEELQCDAYVLVHQYATLVPKALGVATPEEKHRMYKTLRMKVLVNIEVTVAVEIVSGKAPEPNTASVTSGDLCL